MTAGKKLWRNRKEQKKVDLVVANPNQEVRQRLLELFGRKIGNFKEFPGFNEFLERKNN